MGARSLPSQSRPADDRAFSQPPQIAGLRLRIIEEGFTCFFQGHHDKSPGRTDPQPLRMSIEALVGTMVLTRLSVWPEENLAEIDRRRVV
jgi:hypothetical protein